MNWKPADQKNKKDKRYRIGFKSFPLQGITDYGQLLFQSLNKKDSPLLYLFSIPKDRFFVIFCLNQYLRFKPRPGTGP